MLGDQIGEVKGKATGQRVLDIEEGLPKIEHSFFANGRMKEVDITHMSTFWTTPRGNGVLYGEGQGVITTKDDSAEMATYIGRGIGHFTDGGKKVKFRNSFFYRASPTGRLAFLNNLVGVFEDEVDEAGNTTH